MKATAIANSNIALVKFWGKKDKVLIIPNNSSISMSLDKLFTITTVEFSEKFSEDSLKINNKKAARNELERASKHLDLIRKNEPKKLFARIESMNNFPKSAGLASSASSFAALTLAASKALGLSLDKKELSIIARQGSGSASRSIEGGFAELVKGKRADGKDSSTKKIANETHWKELRMIVLVLTEKEKMLGSNEAMSKTVSTSPFYPAWLKTVEADLKKIRKAIREKDFSLLGKTSEMNCLKMHSTMLTTDPHLVYWEPETITLIKEVMALREIGTEFYFTIDAGPQVKVLCLEKDSKKLETHFSKIKKVKKIFVCKPGKEAKLTDKNLF